MRRKIETTIDGALYDQIKDFSRREGKQVDQIIEESLREYLRQRRQGTSVVEATQGTYNVSHDLVRRVLEEDLF